MLNALAHEIKMNQKKHFRRLYDQVLDKLKNDAGITDAAISAVLGSFNLFKKGYFNNLVKICAYLYRYGAHGAGLTGYRVLEALENCAPLRPVLDRRFLKVLSVGGGPFNDVIGFLSAMSQVDQRRMDNGQTFSEQTEQFRTNRKMDIWVADDTSPLWSNVVRETARLVREGEFGYVSQYSIYKVRDIRFFHGTLPSNLHRYDVVIISKFIKSLNRAEQFKLMRDLWSGLRASAFVLLIAAPFRYDLWDDLFDCLYLSDPNKPYFSGTKAVRFGYQNWVRSNAQIAVLRKKEVEYMEIRRTVRQLPADGG